MPLTTGSRVGSYEILAAIGAGGMGEVYRAHDAKLGRDIALKVLPESFAADPDRLARFHREAQVLGSLNHPNIAQIYGFEDSGATHALVMELVEGPTLADRIQHGAIPLAESLAIAGQIVAALEAAHEQGIVHRDLKPANVKVRDDGTVKVLDFGLAKALDPASSSGADVMNSPTLTARATQFGTILGTAAYMAPEQAKGRAVDRRADIWAFGVVLFEMLSGDRAFKGDDVSEVLAAVLRQEIDWKALPAETPANVRRVLERCLQRDPKRRLRDIGDVWIGMDAPGEAAAAGAAVMSAPRGSALARWLPWAVAVAVAAGSVAWAVSRRPDPKPQVVTRSAQPMKELALFVSMSRDGTRLVYAEASRASVARRANGDPLAGGGIVLRMLDQFDGRVVPGTQGGVFPLLSPDGLWIAYNDSTKIRKIPVTGGTSIPLCDGAFVLGGAWGGDNTIVFSSPSGLMRVSADGGAPEALTKVDAAKGEIAHVRPQFLPGGRRLLFTVNLQGEARFAIKDLDKDGYQLVAKGGLNGQYAASGHLTFVRGTTLFAMPFDLARLEVTGGEVPVVEDVSTNGPTGTADYSVSEAGVLAYFSAPDQGGTTLAWADRAGVTKVLPGQPRQVWGTGRLSPDGRLVADGITASSGVRDIWTYDVERGTQTRLSFGGQKERYDNPVWTPDNRRVFFSGDVDGKHGLYVVPVDGSSKPVLALSTESAATPTAIAPDGRTLFYQQAGPDKRLQIFTLPLGADGQPGQPRPLHDAAGVEREAAVSPDGHWVAYASFESGASEVYVLPFPGPGPKIRISLDGGGAPRWSKDGRELLYWANVPMARLMSADVSTSPVFKAGTPRELFQQMSTTTWDVTPDRNRFLVEISSQIGGSTLAIVTNWFDELRRRAPARK
jgi:serine/threonine-protein kinase